MPHPAPCVHAQAPAQGGGTAEKIPLPQRQRGAHPGRDWCGLGLGRVWSRAWGTRGSKLGAKNPFREDEEIVGLLSITPSDFTYKTLIQRENDEKV